MNSYNVESQKNRTLSILTSAPGERQKWEKVKVTAAKLIATAKPEEMSAGTWEIVSSMLPGCLLNITDDGDLSVSDMSGCVCVLEMSAATKEKAEEIAEKVEEAYNA